MVEIPEESEEVAECPTCGAEIALDAVACPKCGQEFEEEEGEYEEEFEEELPEEEYVGEIEEPVQPPAKAPPVVAAAPLGSELPPEELYDELEDDEKPVKMFWIGVILILVGFYGGPILSYLHDALKIPIGIFTAYEVFGWVNWLASIVGTIMLAIGVILLVIGWKKIKTWRERMESLLEEPEPTAEAID
ncbi:MAG: zinc ribbon domain-containing protein [Thermoplasmata archaeon]|nr:zinc ribbon domain-containing protein [Thermoplasmata archaeon]